MNLEKEAGDEKCFFRKFFSANKQCPSDCSLCIHGADLEEKKSYLDPAGYSIVIKKITQVGDFTALSY